MDIPFLIKPKDISSSSKADLIKYIKEQRLSILDRLYDSGALLFREFDLNSSIDFKEVIDSFNSNLLNYLGGDSPRDKLLEGVYTSTNYHANQFISLHNEKSFSKHYPKILWFFCEVEPVIGGETPILDGRKLYRLLDKRIIENFSQKKLKYVMNLHSGEGVGKSWQEAFEVNDKNELENLLKQLNIEFSWKNNGLLKVEEIISPVIKHHVTGEKVFFSQADQWHPSNLEQEVISTMEEFIPKEDFYHNCYYGDGTEIDPLDLDIVRNLVKRELVTFKWKKGDLLMLDNILTLHGRFPYQGERKILVAMC